MCILVMFCCEALELLFHLLSSTSKRIRMLCANCKVNLNSLCSIVFNLLLDQDLPGLAHSFGLLRMPIMKELRGRKDMANFEFAPLGAKPAAVTE